MKKHPLIVLFIYFAHYTIAQNSEPAIEDILGYIISEQEEALPEAYLERLIILHEQPVNINRVSRESLEELFFLTAQDIALIMIYVEKHKPVLSIYELLSIEGVDPETIRKLSLFVKAGVEENYRRLRLFAPGRNQLLYRTDRTFEKKKGYAKPDPSYAGDPWKYLVKFRSYQTDRYSIGLTADQDPGELFEFNRRQLGFDFVSGHVALKGISKTIKQTIIGDFKANFGQGLTIGSGFHFGKSPYVISASHRSGSGITPSSSAYELGYLRGAAMSINLGRYTFTPFYSRKRIDGSMESSATGEERATSIGATGLHRTQNERAKRKALSEQTSGAGLEFVSQNRNLKIGLTYIHTKFSAPIAPDPAVYNQFYFKGQQSWNSGAYINLRWKNIHGFAELATSELKSWAGISGLQAHLSPRISTSVAYRNYGRDYNAFYSSPFGESSFRNEEGIYWGFRIKFNRRINLNLYYDLFRFPWLNYQIYAPSAGNEFLARLNFTPSQNLRMYSQIKLEKKQKNLNEGQLYQLKDYRRMNVQLSINYSPSAWVNLTGKIQRSQFDEALRSSGISYAQDINLMLGSFKWQNRFFIFDTDDFNARHYIYEKDVLYAFSYPSFSGRGFRWYSMIQWELPDSMTFWIKIAQSVYADREAVGAGAEEIQGNKKTDIRFQARYKF